MSVLVFERLATRMIWYIMGLRRSLSHQQQQPDLHNDISAQVFVWPRRTLSNVRYVPRPLSVIPGTKGIISDGKMSLRLDANVSLIAMADALRRDTGMTLIINSAYRWYGTQNVLLKRFGNGKLVARPGRSEHQLGLAIDIAGRWGTATQKAKNTARIYAWLKKNAYKWGWHNSYQNGERIDWYKKEPRHRRYVWVPLATILKRKHQTLTQYFYQNRHLASKHPTPATQPKPPVPVKPPKPVQPVTPVKPQKPVVAPQPIEPLKPETPEKPIEPTKPVDTTIATTSDPSSDGDALPWFDMY